MNKDTDRLGWLRKIRQKIVKKCGGDPKAMGDYFRKIQQQHNSRIFEGIGNDKAFDIHGNIPLFKAAAVPTKGFGFDRNEANER